MSYSGEEVVLCQKGHQHNYDCYYAPDLRSWTCPDCGAAACWHESIDQTNTVGVRTKLVEFKPAVEETCSCCSHTKLISPEQYFIPANEPEPNYKLRYYKEPLVPRIICKYQTCGLDDKAFDTDEDAFRYLEKQDEEERRKIMEFTD